MNKWSRWGLALGVKDRPYRVTMVVVVPDNEARNAFEREVSVLMTKYAVKAPMHIESEPWKGSMMPR